MSEAEFSEAGIFKQMQYRPILNNNFCFIGILKYNHFLPEFYKILSVFFWREKLGILNFVSQNLENNRCDRFQKNNYPALALG